MDLDLHDKIIEQFKLHQQWTQNLCVPHGCCSIDLMCACGPTAYTPTNAIQQPSDYPKRTVYRFDKKFQNLTSKSSICQLIEECTPGAKYIHVRGQNSSNRVEFKCSCYLTTESLEKKKEFEKDEYKQSNTKIVTVKRQKTSGQLKSLDRMSSRKNQNALKLATTDQLKSSSKRMTTSTKAPSKDLRCTSAIVLFLGVDNFWYLDSKSTNLQHYGHVQDLTPKRMGMNDIDDTQSTFIQKLSSSGFAPSQITKLFNIMEEANDHEIDNKTISNLLQKVDLINHGDMNVDHNMSTAEKAIHYLSRLVYFIRFLYQLICPSIESQSLLSLPSNNISHSVVYDDPQLGLSAMSNPRGRPKGKPNVVQLKADERILSEVKKLREEMSFDSEKKFVLIVSFATDVLSTSIYNT